MDKDLKIPDLPWDVMDIEEWWKQLDDRGDRSETCIELRTAGDIDYPLDCGAINCSSCAFYIDNVEEAVPHIIEKWQRQLKERT
jgi:ferredoxin